MLQLLNPIWLFGIGGILIPLIIHLWNVKTGKTLKVGSIMLMGESSRQNSRSLKLMDLLLLFFRCLVIILLSILLADPVWRSTNKKSEDKAWVLLEKDAFPETYSNFKKEIDSLISAGNELHLFQPGFEKAELQEILKDTVSADSTAKLLYWSLIRLLEQEIPQGSKAFIFTGNRLNRFKGKRPTISSPVTWKIYTPSDSSAKWIEHAYLSSSGDIRVIVSESNPRGILRSNVDIQPGTVNSGIKAGIKDGKPVVQLNGQSIIADTTSLKIAIYSKEFPNDSEYLSAAINAIQKYTSRKIKLVETTAEKDFLFWLSAKAVPAEILKTIPHGGSVLKYAGGKTSATNSWIETSEVRLSTEPPALYKRISYPGKTKAFQVWEDGFGMPVLDLTTANNISIYNFYSRLDPEWTDLVWSPDFVKLLMPLLISDTGSPYHEKFDKRSLEPAPILQTSMPAAALAKGGGLSPETSDLNFLFWLLVVFAFLTERWLSFKNSTIS